MMLDRLNDGYSSCQDEQAWAVAVGTISAFVCLVMGILFVFASGIAGQANKVSSLSFPVYLLC